MKKEVWSLYFFAVGVFLVNFNFSFPRVPRVATLPFFLVLVVTEKIKISSKILARFRGYDTDLLRMGEIFI